jgi:hypothetical protein
MFRKPRAENGGGILGLSIFRRASAHVTPEWGWGDRAVSPPLYIFMQSLEISSEKFLH